MNQLRDRGASPLVIAHRGASAHAPENTLEAAQLGWETGAEGWELDVQLSRDGVPIVIHDPSLSRTTDVAEVFADDDRRHSGFRVADFDLSEIQRLDAGSWFLADTGPVVARSARAFATLGDLKAATVDRIRSGTVRVPTLRSCLELTVDLGWPVNVELKSETDRSGLLQERVAYEVERLAIANRVLISSFDHDEVARAVRRGIGWATGVLTTHPLHRPREYVRQVVGADCYHPAATAFRGGEAATSEPADAVMPILVYTVNDARPGGLATQLAGQGVAAIFTDQPALIRQRFLDIGPISS